MNRSVSEQALMSLLPSLSGPIPSSLLNHAISILAQSRSKASSLKPEEEVARPYACAHLACERMKQQLNLPQIQPRPPVPNRIYKKLYNYFDSAIPVRLTQSTNNTPVKPTASRTRTPQKPTPSQRITNTPTKSATTPKLSLQNRTPSKSQHENDKTPTRPSSRKRAASPIAHISANDTDPMDEDDSVEEDELHSAEEQELPHHKNLRSQSVVGGINLRSGLGTMFVDSIDWLSEENKDDYERWSRDVRRRIDQMKRT